MGVACTMGRILQKRCGGTPREEPVPLCPTVHLDPVHARTVLIEAMPPTWQAPVTVDWGDGTVDVVVDGEDAHAYDAAGTYTVTASDVSGAMCVVDVVVV